MMLQVTVQPFIDAAKPLEIMSALLGTWIHRKHVSGPQLDAWVLARQSFLHNECTLMLKENDAIVVFMLLVMCILMLLNVFLVFTSEKVAISAVGGALVTGFGALTCIKAAIACYKEQQRHRSQLRRLKEAIIVSTHSVYTDATNKHERIKQIDIIIQNLEKQDYQTRIKFLPLNPATFKAIIGYIVTAATLIGGKVLVMQTGSS
jgi:hypothetical protein